MKSHRSGYAWGPQVGLALVVAILSLLTMSGVAAANVGSRAQSQTGAVLSHQQNCANAFTVSPNAGPVGTKLTIRGSNWPVNQQVGIYFVDTAHTLHPYNLGAPGVLKNGTWQLTISVPSTVIFTPQAGDEGSALTQKVTSGGYLVYATTGTDQQGFAVNEVCPVKFTVTKGSVAGYMGTASANSGASLPWVTFGVGLLVMVLLLLGVIAVTRRWSYHKARTIAAAAALILIVVGVPTVANAFTTRPVTAHSAQTASGGVLYSDDFESDTIGSLPVGWVADAGTTWSVQSDGSNVLKQTSSNTSNFYGIHGGDPTWTDYSISASVKPGVGGTLQYHSSVRMDGRRTDPNNLYMLDVQNGNLWYLAKKVNGNFIALAQGSTSYNTTSWYTWTLTMTGNTISASINGVTLATVTDGSFSSGNMSFWTHSQSEFDNIVVTSTGAGGGPTPTPTSTSTPTPTAGPTNTPTPTPTAGPTNTPTPTPTAGPTNTPTPTPTAGPTNTPTPTPTNTPTPTTAPTKTPTAGPTNTPTPTPTNTPTPTPVPGGTGNITGIVTDGAGTPISGAQISTLPSSTTTTTDSSGSYTLANVATGSYGIVAAASGYNSSYVNVAVTANNTVTADESLNGVPAYTSMDTYYRPDQNGWNPASDGSTWADDGLRYPGGVATIAKNQGYVDTGTTGTDRDEWMGATYTDQLVSADFEVLQVGSNTSQHGTRLLGRVSDAHHYIVFAMNGDASTLALWVNDGENWTLLSQVNISGLQANQWYHARLLIVGNEVFGKVWAYGTAEPGWLISATQTTLRSGTGGLRTVFADSYWANFTVQGLTAITGKVTDSSGKAIAGASVSDGTNSVLTDSNGLYTLIEPNQTATYTVTASATGFNSNSQSATVTNQSDVTVNLTLS